MSLSDPESLFELMDRLTENSVAITQVTAALSELNSRLNVTNQNLEKFTEEIRKTLADHEVRIVDVEHNCRKEPNWDRVWSRLDALEQAEMKRLGAKQFEIQRIDQIETRLDRGAEQIQNLNSQLKSHLDVSQKTDEIEGETGDHNREYILVVISAAIASVSAYILAKVT
jgi:DNA repair exonuclease SbcCD ATPase subunit